jgi:hypothetical protein
MATITGVHVKLIGEDGNSYSVMGATTRAMRRAGVSKEVIDEYKEKAMAGDYNNLLAVTMEYVEVE